jgi:hypothetical protein
VLSGNKRNIIIGQHFATSCSVFTSFQFVKRPPSWMVYRGENVVPERLLAQNCLDSAGWGSMYSMGQTGFLLLLVEMMFTDS